MSQVYYSAFVLRGTEMNEREIIIGISKAPEDPEKKKEWVSRWARVQFAMYVDDGATCEHCGHKYESVDDFIKCNPKRGFGKQDKMTFVCNDCWVDYEKAYTRSKGSVEAQD